MNSTVCHHCLNNDINNKPIRYWWCKRCTIEHCHLLEEMLIQYFPNQENTWVMAANHIKLNLIPKYENIIK